MGNPPGPSGSAPPAAISTSAPSDASSLPRSFLAPPGGPPSRPGTSLSRATSIDDLLGEPHARKGPAGSTRGKKKGRYVDVMAK